MKLTLELETSSFNTPQVVQQEEGLRQWIDFAVHRIKNTDYYATLRCPYPENRFDPSHGDVLFISTDLNQCVAFANSRYADARREAGVFL